MNRPRTLIPVLVLLAGTAWATACGDGATEPPTVVPVVAPDFFGQVLIPVYQRSRDQSEPVEGVTVTIIAGPRSGESVQTNLNGQYIFPEFDGDEIHIRLEKAEYEPKEVIVHRTKATVLRNDPLPLEYGGPQDQSGNVLIGAVWPEYAREVMEKMPTIADLLMIIVPDGRGQYGFGVIVQNDPRATPESAPLLHELCHAWQHGVVRPRGGGTGSGTDWHAEWVSSREGLAYREAREADRGEIGYNPINVVDQTGASWTESQLILVEESAEFCNYWWGDGSDLVDIDHWRAWLREHAPNRTQWLERFLGL